MHGPEMTPETPEPSRKERRSRNNYIAGIVLVTLGILFLLQNYFNLELIAKLWPVILLAIGLALIWRNR